MFLFRFCRFCNFYIIFILSFFFSRNSELDTHGYLCGRGKRLREEKRGHFIESGGAEEIVAGVKLWMGGEGGELH